MKRTRKGERRERRGASARRGVMLLLVIFSIVMATSLATLIMAGTSQLIRTSSSEHESMVVRQLTDSAWAWVLAHKGMPSGKSVTLDGKGLLAEGVWGEARIHFVEGVPDTFQVTVILEFSGHRVLRTTRFRFPS